MSKDIIVPVLGESVTEATVARWLKKEGEQVNADEPVVELETDKVNLEVPSPVSGVISKINSKDGENVEVGSVLGIVSSSQIKSKLKEDKDEKIPPQTQKIIEEAEKNVKKDLDDVNKTKLFDKENPEEEPLILTNEISNGDAKIINKHLSPAVRKLVTEKNLKLEGLIGSGKNGTILKGDLLGLMNRSPQPNQRKIKYGPEERIQVGRRR